MHKQGDVVVYVEAGVESNALVISSSSRADIFPGQAVDPNNPPAVVEHVNLVLVPEKTDGVPNLTPVAHGLFLRTVFGVRPADSGAVSGFKELVEGAEQIAELQEKVTSTEELVLQRSTELAQQDEKIAALQAELANTTEGKDAALQAIADAGARKPSAADLDAVAAEQKAREETATLVIEPCTCKDPAPVLALTGMACGKCGGDLPHVEQENAIVPQEPCPIAPAGTEYFGIVETTQYSDGSSATGTAPLPDQSPEQQEQHAQ